MSYNGSGLLTRLEAVTSWSGASFLARLEYEELMDFLERMGFERKVGTSEFPRLEVGVESYKIKVRGKKTKQDAELNSYEFLSYEDANGEVDVHQKNIMVGVFFTRKFGYPYLNASNDYWTGELDKLPPEETERRGQIKEIMQANANAYEILKRSFYC